jgi:hypothetical protein
MRAFSMISRRLAALTLSLLTFAGCHEDPTVEAILVQPSTVALGLFSAGGNASSVAGLDGVGGAGGNFTVTTNGLISLGSPSFVPSAPAVPAVPSTFEYVAVAGQATITKVGSIQITGSITTATTTPVVITSSSGDILVDGALQSGDTGAAQADLQLVAPSGTVFVTGSIRTAGVDSALNGRAGGNLTINAARVVITGTIDTHGVANTTVVAANGGKGGDVDVTSSLGPIYITAGSIVTTGGLAVDTAGIASVTGGAGGFVHLNSAAPVNSIYIFAPVATDGGAMTGNGTAPTGGAAGSVVMRGSGEVDIVASVSMLGGAATGNNTDAVGGAGGNLSVNGPAVCKLYGSVLAGGGTAFAAVTGSLVAGLVGGAGGSVLLGQISKLNSVELGSGDFNQAGGTGGRSVGTGGGSGGAVLIESYDGDITIASSFSVAGGAASGIGNASGGGAGTIAIQTDAQAAGNLSNHLLSIPSLSSLLDATGGAALGTGTGGVGGNILLQCGGDLTSGARINASGGSSVIGIGGATTPISPPIATVNATSAVVLRIAAANLTPTGNMSVAETIQTQGGATTSGGTGGSGSSITLQISGGNGSLSSSATLNTTGASDLVGAGGSSGSLFLVAQGGDLNLSGTLTVSGSDSPLTPNAAGNVTVQSGGVLQSSALINAVGGASTDATGAAVAQKGGDILFDATSSFSPITLLPGTSLIADGGATTGVAPTTFGGAGGTITLRSLGRAIDMSGSLLARGGAGSGTTTGGPGGQVLVVTDLLNSGTSGNITLEGGSLIDVSGGSGSVLGPARFSPTGDPGATLLTSPVIASLAVIFDANDGLANSGVTNQGRIANLGSIVATGSHGGDVWYNGLNSSGLALNPIPTPTDSGSLTQTGATVPQFGQFYPH